MGVSTQAKQMDRSKAYSTFVSKWLNTCDPELTFENALVNNTILFCQWIWSFDSSNYMDWILIAVWGYIIIMFSSSYHLCWYLRVRIETFNSRLHVLLQLLLKIIVWDRREGLWPSNTVQTNNKFLTAPWGNFYLCQGFKYCFHHL